MQSDVGRILWSAMSKSYSRMVIILDGTADAIGIDLEDISGIDLEDISAAQKQENRSCYDMLSMVQR